MTAKRTSQRHPLIPAGEDVNPTEDALLQARIVERVIVEVGRVYLLNPTQITGRAQTERIAEARALAMTMCSVHANVTHAQIAQRFSGWAAGAVGLAKRTYERHRIADRDRFRSKAFTVDRRVREAFG